MRGTITFNQRQSAHLLDEGLLMKGTLTFNQRQSAHLLEHRHPRVSGERLASEPLDQP